MTALGGPAQFLHLKRGVIARSDNRLRYPMQLRRA